MVEDSTDRCAEGTVTILALPTGKVLIFTGMNTNLVTLAVGAKRSAIPPNLFKMGHRCMMSMMFIHYLPCLELVHQLSGSLSSPKGDNSVL